MRSLFVFALVGCLVIACGKPKTLTPEELSTYVMEEKHGLVKTQEAGNYTVQVQYRPTDLLVHQELGGVRGDGTQISTLKKKYSGYDYFILSLSRDGKEALHRLDGGMEQYSELVQVLSFRMGNYVNITTSQRDTIEVADFRLNRTYGMSTSTDLLFVFSREKSLGKDWVQFNLNEFGMGVGNLRFRFRRKDLDQCPGIEFIEITE